MKISVITTTLNSEKTLEATINSIIENKKTCNCDVEYIIIDGGSVDGTRGIIERYQNEIDLFISEKDDGISDAFNKGIYLATGDIIGLINSDDMLTDNALQLLCNSIDDDTDVFYGDGYYLEKSNKMKKWKVGKPEDLRWDMSLFHPSVFVRKKAYLEYGMFDVNLKCVMDRELLLRMYINGAKFQYIPYRFSIYRAGGESYKNYFKYVIPESERITIQYGGSKTKAKLLTVKKSVVMRIVFLKKRMFDGQGTL